MSEEIDKAIIRKFDLLNKLGKGAYGIVWKAIDRTTQKTVALKKCFDAFQSSTGMMKSMNSCTRYTRCTAYLPRDYVPEAIART
jgi:hypothetical protein